MDELNSFLNIFLKGKRKKEKYFSAYLQVHWPEIAGEYFYRKSFPKIIKDGILFLDVASPSWAHNFFMVKNEIIKKINDSSNAIIVNDIKFTVKVKLEVTGKQEEQIKEKIQVELNDKEIDEIKEILADIDNKMLSDSLCVLITKDKKRKKHFKQSGFSCCIYCEIPLAYAGSICAACEKQLKEKEKEDLIQMFYDIPWLSFEQAKTELSISEGDFFSVKNECTRVFLTHALKEGATNTEIKRYVMIKTACNAFDLTEEIVAQAMEGTRRKKDVSAHRR